MGGGSGMLAQGKIFEGMLVQGKFLVVFASFGGDFPTCIHGQMLRKTWKLLKNLKFSPCGAIITALLNEFMSKKYHIFFRAFGANNLLFTQYCI